MSYENLKELTKDEIKSFMNEPQPELTATETAKQNFVSRREFDVTLTYGFLDAPIVFPCKLMLDNDDKAARQAFFAQPDGDQERGSHMYNVDMMSRIIVGIPKGLPGFVAPESLSRLPGAIKSYFETGEPILIKIAAEFNDVYVKQTSPPEFFR